ncbi:polyketide synthesis O-methyltransferase [Thozetella sp. PMI_491]|nr:polyketide synthesis O-methyltransferase [Thozetella sp. PMI_491]
MSKYRKVKTKLCGVEETTLLTLGARALDAKKPHPLLNDTWAVEALDQIHFTPVDHEGFNISIVLRARLMDVWTAQFLDANPAATVIHLGCGLDARALRLSWGPRVRWYDVDLPEVVELRRQVVTNPMGDYHLLAASATEGKWLEDIPTDRPALIIMEGLLPYFEEKDIEQLIQRLCNHFKSGRLVFDTVGKLFVRLQNVHGPISGTGAIAKFGMDDAHVIEKMHPSLKLRDVLQIWELPGLELVPWIIRLFMYIYSWLPGFRTYLSYQTYDF